MPSARKRKSISSSGGNTLLSYFAPGTTGAGSSNGTDIITTAAQSPSAWKKPKVERNSVSPFDGKENRFWPGLEGGGGKGTREEPIEIMPDEDDDDDDEEEVARVVEEVSVKEDIEVINLDVEEKTSPSSSTAEDPLPLRDCTPPPAPDPPPTLTSQTADPSSFALRDVPDIEFGEDEWEMGDDELVPAEVGTEYGGDDGDGDRDAVEEEGEDIGDFEDEGGVEGAADEKDGEGGEGTNDLGCPICGTIVEDLNKLVRAPLPGITGC
ncbi:hypothetical protein CALVIDRAFT_93839 [Calocera viscosa TUFC12733]|uniref:Uncharacterized protein n=1 Tax=Calocera viscosa (strain TUFC12733) TaxID=1330018 RepID=A0A167MWU5_CALVF|nr:hypothetical protein CALVIDRAFT_93839 [Calocera viscosa TUFC12733]